MLVPSPFSNQLQVSSKKIQHHISKSADQLQNLGVIIGQLRIEHITTNQLQCFRRRNISCDLREDFKKKNKHIFDSSTFLHNSYLTKLIATVSDFKNFKYNANVFGVLFHNPQR